MNYTYLKQSGFHFESNDKNFYIDPFDLKAGEPLADAILITHAHYDHFDPTSIDLIRKKDTLIYCPTDVSYEIPLSNAVSPGDRLEIFGISVEALPAYNLKSERETFHPKANGWLGYLVHFPGASVYHAGDTDLIPEMRDIRTDLALLPVGGTYTMDAAEAGAAAKEIKPKKGAIPMHYGAVVGKEDDAHNFAEAASPVKVEIIAPKYQ